MTNFRYHIGRKRGSGALRPHLPEVFPRPTSCDLAVPLPRACSQDTVAEDAELPVHRCLCSWLWDARQARVLRAGGSSLEEYDASRLVEVHPMAV